VKPAKTSGRESGQALILFAAGLVVMMALVGLSIDIGQLVLTRTDMQKTADAAAFAGAQDLNNTTLAEQTAQSYVTQNGSATATVAFSNTFGVNDTIEVEASRTVNYTFLKVLGMTSHEVSAKAKVRVAVHSGGKGLLPFGFIASNANNSHLLSNSCYLGNDADGLPMFQQNVQCQIKYGAGTQGGGDFGALTLGDEGGDNYRENIENGSTLPFKKGDKVNSETGVLDGPTRQGMDDRFDLPPPDGCPGNARNDVLITNPDGTVSIRPGCEDSPRIGIIPVVDKIDNPHKSTILGFSYVYLSGMPQGNGGGSTIFVEFVKFVSELPNQSWDGDISSNAARFIKLVE
jgi:hypothetical protein